MDDTTNPGGSQGTPADDSGATRRMDTPTGGFSGQSDYGTPASPAPYQYTPPADATPPQYGAPPAPPYQYTPPADTTPPQYGAPPAQPYQYAPPPDAAPQYGAPAAPDQPYQFVQPPTPTAPQPYQYAQPPQPYNTVPGGYTPTPNAGMSNYAANPPIRDPMTAMIIEMVGGFFGFMGIGNMLAGRLIPGLILMVSWWVIIGVGFTLLTVATCGLGICLVIPLWIAGPILSGFYLRGEMTGSPLFKR